eukprot:1540126-Pleurochrysis_carterae.AAC.3
MYCHLASARATKRVRTRYRVCGQPVRSNRAAKGCGRGAAEVRRPVLCARCSDARRAAIRYAAVCPADVLLNAPLRSGWSCSQRDYPGYTTYSSHSFAVEAALILSATLGVPSSRTAGTPSLVWASLARKDTRTPVPPTDAVGGEQGLSCWQPNPPRRLCLRRARRCGLSAADRLSPRHSKPRPSDMPRTFDLAGERRPHDRVRSPRHDVQLPRPRKSLGGHLAHHRADFETRLSQPRASPLRSYAQAR